MNTDNYFCELTDLPYAVKRPVSERITLMKNDIDNIKTWLFPVR